MSFDDGLADRAFSAVALPRRPAKPRDTGITLVADKGLGPHAVDDLLELSADSIDWVKIASSSARLHRPEALAAKTARYRAAGVQVLLAGDFLELAAVQGVSDEVYAQAAELGFTAVEVASSQTVISWRDSAALVRRAAAHGLLVFGEVGRKGGGPRPGAAQLAAQADALLEAGAARIVLQGEGLLEDVPELATDVLVDVAARVDLERTVVQAKQTRAQVWLIETFGPHVSLDVDVDSVVTLELLRRGARHRGLLGTVATVAPGP